MKKSWRDRKDAKYIKMKDPVHRIIPYIIPTRHEAEVYLKETLDVTELVKFIDKKKKEKEYKVTYFHAFATALAKVMYHRPLLNRFIKAKKFYERNDVTISFIAKDSMSDEAEEKLMVLKIKPDMNFDSISKKITKDVNKVRSEGTNSIDKTMNIVTSLPRPLITFIVWLLKRLDAHGWAPKFTTDGDYNFTSVLFTNLGSIKCEPCYHHLNDWGTNSIIIAIGTIRKEKRLMENDKEEIRNVIDIGFTADERIADGFYFAKSINLIKYIVEHPELLDEEIDKEIEYEKNKEKNK